MDNFLVTFVAALYKNEAVCGILSGSIEVNNKVLIHSKSIPEKVRGDARLFCISGWPVIGHRYFSQGNDSQISAGDRSSCGPSGRFAPEPVIP
jgi:hypothetical protein